MPSIFPHLVVSFLRDNHSVISFFLQVLSSYFTIICYVIISRLSSRNVWLFDFWLWQIRTSFFHSPVSLPFHILHPCHNYIVIFDLNKPFFCVHTTLPNIIQPLRQVSYLSSALPCVQVYLGLLFSHLDICCFPNTAKYLSHSYQ